VAHSKPDGIANKGDAWRISTAAGAFVIELLIDKRVKALYEQWRHARETAGAALDVALAHGTEADLPAIRKTFFEDYNAREIEATQLAVRDELRLAFPWVAPALLHGFRLRVHNEQHPENEKPLGIQVFMQPGAEKGRKPRNEGEDLIRAVRWYYRLKVQEPPESIHDLARDYAAWAGRDNDCRSVIQNAVDQVQALLDLVSERFIVLK
jgi:hypothetical protein